MAISLRVRTSFVRAVDDKAHRRRRQRRARAVVALLVAAIFALLLLPLINHSPGVEAGRNRKTPKMPTEISGRLLPDGTFSIGPHSPGAIDGHWRNRERAALRDSRSAAEQASPLDASASTARLPGAGRIGTGRHSTALDAPHDADRIDPADRAVHHMKGPAGFLGPRAQVRFLSGTLATCEAAGRDGRFRTPRTAPRTISAASRPAKSAHGQSSCVRTCRPTQTTSVTTAVSE